MENGPWEFGWNQLLTIVGFVITSIIAVASFKTFGRWRREKLEERRIDIALQAMALVFESKYVFEMIRSPLSHQHEWADMPESFAASEEKRSALGPYYVILDRIDRQKDFFQSIYKIQPQFMAVFGNRAEEPFSRIHERASKL